ncbi:MAG: rRNA pseudouridine synthase [Deltaproteobacteria bacterium]|nr:rRNA pseudouridine synthase [Deltaproteobacteria bacterium]
MTKQRLQKVIARAGICSRRKAEDYIANGRVSVNEKVVCEPGTSVDPETDLICVDGKELRATPTVLYRFYKPRDVITSMQDTHGRKTVGDFARQLPTRVFPVGRLDRDVTGLLLLTNDGEFAQRMLHPRFSVPRTYYAVVPGKPKQEVFTRLKRGLELDCGFGCVLDAHAVKASKRTIELFGNIERDSSIISVTVTLGRKHFVKKILAAVGYPVKQLCRVSFGPYFLGNLRPGEIVKESINTSIIEAI